MGKRKAPKPNCTTCGICCVSPVDQPSFCDVDEDDEKRLGAQLVRCHVLYPSMVDAFATMLDHHPAPQGAIKTIWKEEWSGPFKGYQFCRCVFLQGSVMRKVKCRVYDDRPRVCRMAMKPGDKACTELRRSFQKAVENLGDFSRKG